MPHVTRATKLLRRNQAGREEWLLLRVPSGTRYVLLHTGPEGEAYLVEERLPGKNENAVIDVVQARHSSLNAVLLTGQGDAASAIAEMKAEAARTIEISARFIDQPSSVRWKFKTRRNIIAQTKPRNPAQAAFTQLTPREREVLDRVLDGQPNKLIAADLGINQRTVENHRASVMRKTGATCLPALVMLAVAAGVHTA